jgi:hydrogenase maturation protein HypF
MANKTSTYLIVVRGLVQGVGFRPFIYRTAVEHHLDGRVLNTSEDVRIRLNATPRQLRAFLDSVRKKAPPASDIQAIDCEETGFEEFSGFRISGSRDESGRVTRVSPDIAVCEDCLRDMKIQPHRLDYPFLNCTNCGPRFTIIRDLPYDRGNTTMSRFRMCPRCAQEYHDVQDRRFHAQPVACNSCGPHYTLDRQGRIISGMSLILAETVRMIDEGMIVAIKGMGGFHLACDALNDRAVSRLRSGKERERKPFAVMFRDVKTLRGFARVSEAEEELLASWQRPILVLASTKPLAEEVSMGFRTVGAMLPYMPLHHLLFERLATPAIVLTSGNISDEPIIISNEEAGRRLGPVSDAVLSYDREIHNRTDDSVAFVTGTRMRMIRRSRGFAPQPVILDLDVDSIFAAGAELVNCFCVGRQDMAILSQHIGDLKNFETYSFYGESAERFMRLFRVTPRLAVHDLHPDYLSTKFAAGLGIESLAVQHHHAHIVSAMAEHGINEKVAGVSFDGTGFGADGHIWGGEFLICDRTSFERYTHFAYTPMPGGDMVTSEPWRMAVSYLYAIYGQELYGLDLPFLRDIPSKQLGLITAMIDKGVNAPLSSSCGRLFDAVSAMLGICTRSGFHAEAPMRLENAAASNETGQYAYITGDDVNFEPMFRQMVRDIRTGLDASIISARFHNTLAGLTEEILTGMRDEKGPDTVVLSGGTFQNRYLLEELLRRLPEKGFRVFTNSRIPANDGGIALGQLVIGASLRTC